MFSIKSYFKNLKEKRKAHRNFEFKRTLLNKYNIHKKGDEIFLMCDLNPIEKLDHSLTIGEVISKINVMITSAESYEKNRKNSPDETLPIE